MTPIHFSLYRRGELLTVRAELHDDALRWDGGGAAHVEQVERFAYVPPKEVRKPLSREDELRANCAVDYILRVAAAYTHQPWDLVTCDWMEWAPLPKWHRPMDEEDALADAVFWWGKHQKRLAADDNAPPYRGPDYGAPPSWR